MPSLFYTSQLNPFLLHFFFVFFCAETIKYGLPHVEGKAVVRRHVAGELAYPVAVQVYEPAAANAL